MRSNAPPIALAFDSDDYDALIEELQTGDALKMMSSDIVSVVADDGDQHHGLWLRQATRSLTSDSNYLWQCARVMRVSLYEPRDQWDSHNAARLYRGLRSRPLCDLRELRIGNALSSTFIAALLLHTPRLEVLEVSPIQFPDTNVRHLFHGSTGEELFLKKLPFPQYTFRLRRLAYRGFKADELFLCHLFDQSRAKIEWLVLPPTPVTARLLACLERGNCVTTLVYPNILGKPELAHRLVAAFPRVKRLVLDAADLVDASVLLSGYKASLRRLALGWYDIPGLPQQEAGLRNLLAVLPQLTLRELTFQHPRISEAPMPSCPPELLAGIRAACWRRRIRITHSVHAFLTDGI